MDYYFNLSSKACQFEAGAPMRGSSGSFVFHHFGNKRLVKECISAASIRFRNARSCSKALVAVRSKYYNEQSKSQRVTLICHPS